MGVPSPSSRAAAAALCLVAVVVAAAVGPIPSRAESTSCANDLIPCAEYINGTSTPPSSCCDSIKKAVTTELSCLCTLYETPGLLASFGVNVTQAVGLSQRCGVKTDLSACASSTAPSGSATPPPGVPGNDGNKIAMTGFSSLLLVLTSFLLN